MASNITIFTDASFDDRDYSAGGAFWAKGPNEIPGSPSIKKEGYFGIFDATCSGTAEALATLKGIHFLLEDPEFHSVFSRGRETLLIVVVDCMAVKHLMDCRSTALTRNPVVQDLFASFRDARETMGFNYKVNHVPAHRSDGTPRTWVNNWCDIHAKKARRKMIRDRLNRELEQAWKDPAAYLES